MLGKEKIVFDPANMADTDSVGAFVRAEDGTLITHTADGSKQRLDVATGAEHKAGEAFAASQGGMAAWAVDPDGNYAPFKVNAAGELIVDVQLTSGSDKINDDASGATDVGTYVLSVRQDSLSTTTSASGDFQSFKSDALGSTWVHVSATAQAPADNTLAHGQQVVTMTAAPITASLPTRRRIIVQNVDNSKPFFLGDSGVAISNGLRVSPGSVLEIELAAGTDLYAVAAVASVAARVLETGHA